LKDKIILPDPVSISSEEIAPIMAQMAAIQLSLAARLIAEKSESPQDENDTLLKVEEAAARLKCSEDWLYRRAKNLSRLRFELGEIYGLASVGLRRRFVPGGGLLER